MTTLEPTNSMSKICLLAAKLCLVGHVAASGYKLHETSKFLLLSSRLHYNISVSIALLYVEKCQQRWSGLQGKQASVQDMCAACK